MNDGWYRVTLLKTSNYVVKEFQNNRCDLGTVAALEKLGCTFEPVQVLNQEELSHLITTAYQAGAEKAKELITEQLERTARYM